MKKSLLLLVSVLAIPTMLASCSKKANDKPAESSVPAEPEKDPNELLEGFEEATEITIGTPYTTVVNLEIGVMNKFKAKYAEGQGKDHLWRLSISGTAISAQNNVEIKVLDYKGDVIEKKDALAWGKYDGWVYLTAIKSEADGNSSVISRIDFDSLDKRLPIITDGEEELKLNDTLEHYKERWFTFDVKDANKNYAISIHTTGGTYQMNLKNNSLSTMTIDDSFITKYKYNFTATETGLHALRIYANTANDVNFVSAAIVQIDPAS